MTDSECVHHLYSSANNKLIVSIDRLQHDPNTPKIKLTQSHFDNGTYRIKTPGIYWLSEDIEFCPNSNIYGSSNCQSFPNVLDNFQPTAVQIQNKEYSIPPYQFGFFAAITIE